MWAEPPLFYSCTTRLASCSVVQPHPPGPIINTVVSSLVLPVSHLLTLPASFSLSPACAAFLDFPPSQSYSLLLLLPGIFPLGLSQANFLFTHGCQFKSHLFSGAFPDALKNISSSFHPENVLHVVLWSFTVLFSHSVWCLLQYQAFSVNVCQEKTF
jgi:hypothetical protein